MVAKEPVMEKFGQGPHQPDRWQWRGRVRGGKRRARESLRQIVIGSCDGNDRADIQPA